MLKTLLNISSRPEGILHRSCKFYSPCMDNANVSIILVDSLKVFREDFCFNSVDMLLQIFGLNIR